MTQLFGLMIAVGGVAGLLFVLAKPKWAFVLLMVMFPLEQLLQAYLPALQVTPWIINVAMGALALTALALRLLKSDGVTRAYPNKATALIIALYLLWAAGIMYSPAGYQGERTVVYAVMYQALLLIVFPLLILDLREFRSMIPGMLVISTVIGVLIMMHPSTSYQAGRMQLDLGMVGGMFDRGNPLAVAEMGSTAALIAALIKPARARALYTILRAVAFVVGMGLAIGSGSRGQVLAVVLTGIAFYPLARQLANPKQFVLAMIGFGVLVFGLYFTFNTFIGHQNRERWEALGMIRDTQLRLDMVWELFDAWLSSPAHWLFGLGTSAYATIGGSVHADYVHNIAAEILCEHGIVGFLLFIGIAWFTFKYGFQLWLRERHDASARSTAALLMAICVFMLLLSLKQGSMSFPAPFLWWIVLAKIAKHEERFGEIAVDAIDYDRQPEGESLAEAEEAGVSSDDSRDPGYALGY